MQKIQILETLFWRDIESFSIACSVYDRFQNDCKLFRINNTKIRLEFLVIKMFKILHQDENLPTFLRIYEHLIRMIRIQSKFHVLSMSPVVQIYLFMCTVLYVLETSITISNEFNCMFLKEKYIIIDFNDTV